MNSLAAFAQRTEIGSRFRQALLIFWVPLITAAAVPAFVISISALVDTAIASRWPIVLVLVFSFLIAIAWGAKEFQTTENELTSGRIFFATYAAIVVGTIAVFSWSAIVAPRPRSEIQAHDHSRRVDLNCRNCGGPDVDMDSPKILNVPPTPPPIERVPLPRPNPFRR
jgi:hypothetical protein